MTQSWEMWVWIGAALVSAGLLLRQILARRASKPAGRAPRRHVERISSRSVANRSEAPKPKPAPALPPMGPERPAALLFRRRSDVRTVLVLSPASALDGADAVRFPVAPAESEAWGAFLASAAPIEREERGDGRILWLASMIEDEPEAQELEAVWLDRTGAPMGEPARADDLVGRWTALRSSIERTSGSAVLFEAQAAGDPERREFWLAASRLTPRGRWLFANARAALALSNELPAIAALDRTNLLALRRERIAVEMRSDGRVSAVLRV